MKKIGISLIILALISVGILSGCTGTPNNQSSQQEPETTSSTQKPYFVISDYAARRGFEGINYIFYIDFVVQNIGNASGQARVWSELNQNGNHYEKHQDFYLNAGGTQSYTFRYPEYSFWSTDPGSYLVWVENS
jgi:hypothetical protein